MLCPGLRSIARRYSTSQPNYYQILDLPTNATIKEIKVKFKQLSKKHHPDLNGHLSEDEKEENASKYLEMVTAYDTLKDIKKKKSYDSQLRVAGVQIANHAKREWNNKYYGEAKYYSKSGYSYSSSGLNTKRHKIRYHNSQRDVNNSTFHGSRTDYSDRYDVPHFDYDTHLKNNLKFEKRIIDKALSAEEQKRLLQTISTDGKALDEEMAIKYLLHHVRTMQANGTESVIPKPRENGSFQTNPHMFQSHRPPQNDSKIMPKLLMFGGATGGFYFLWHALMG
ncbi:hypothetical protein DIURU_002778 [Diutina rugosa]|uniref:J domain-containing protein n=1 Tax=Diutina rugosa TaxID=5481 RepID=A0A642UN36_DIURU|nr:uncharacterized protein DIURU_002778 [Diutina rugosa]KAA8902324.1 hypothetical protein DIURU_002778 [Diutina rugosa]